MSGNLDLSFEWDFGDGTPNGTSSVVTHLYMQIGIFNVTLKVTDFDGDISFCVYNITVLPNTVPTISISANSTLILVSESVFFMDMSYGGDGPSLWNWNFGDSLGNITYSSNTNFSHQYNAPGNYTVVCTITDNDGESATASILIQVETDYIPNAVFVLSKLTFNINEVIQFNAPDQLGNFPLSYEWNFGDGSINSTLKTNTYSYSVAGNYTITLRVVDRDGDITVYSIMIAIVSNSIMDNLGIEDLIAQPWFPYASIILLIVVVMVGILKMRSNSINVKKGKKRKKNAEPSVDSVDFQF